MKYQPFFQKVLPQNIISWLQQGICSQPGTWSISGARNGCREIRSDSQLVLQLVLKLLDGQRNASTTSSDSQINRLRVSFNRSKKQNPDHEMHLQVKSTLLSQCGTKYQHGNLLYHMVLLLKKISPDYSFSMLWGCVRCCCSFRYCDDHELTFRQAIVICSSNTDDISIKIF